MIITTNSFLNVRVGAPLLSAPNPNYHIPANSIEVVDIVDGDDINGNWRWFKDAANNYYWSGGTVEGISCAPQNDPLFLPVNYNLIVSGVPMSWRTTKGAGVKVAVLDSGINRTHVNLQQIKPANIIDNSFSTTLDNTGHGTHVAGLIGAQQGNTGISGVAPDCELVIIKVRHPNAGITFNRLANGIATAIQQNVNIINLSLGDLNPIHPLVQQAINNALAKNILVVAAAGDDDTLKGTPYNPGALAGCHPVGAVTPANAPLLQGHLDPRTEFVMPLTDITSCGLGQNTFAKMAGCSMSTAFISGMLALGLSALGKDNPANVVDQLKQNAKSFIDFSPSSLFQIYKP